MAEKNGKQTFLHGAALLALATAIVKVIGALYKIPLKMVIGDEGYAYFMTAYDIYTVLLLIAMLASAASCGGAEPSADTTAAPQNDDTPAETTIPRDTPDFEKTDFGGKTFTILDYQFAFYDNYFFRHGTSNSPCKRK